VRPNKTKKRISRRGRKRGQNLRKRKRMQRTEPTAWARTKKFKIKKPDKTGAFWTKAVGQLG